MTYKEYMTEFINHYKLDGLLDYARCSGRNLFHKKLLIFILRTRFHVSYARMAEIFKNNHTTILYHYRDACDNPLIEESLAEALKLYKEDNKEINHARNLQTNN